MNLTRQNLSIAVPMGDTGSTRVSALLLRPADPKALLVLGHGAGAGMRHAFMQELTSHLATCGLATLRYQFPYTEAGRRRPDPPARLIATVRSAVATAKEIAPELPLFAGGKSMGGRMTSLAMADRALDDVRGLVFVGFPLHPAGSPSNKRAAHLSAVEAPMLFLQGTRDRLADLPRMRSVCDTLAQRATLRNAQSRVTTREASRAPEGSVRTTLHVIDGADHGFKVLKRLGRTEDEVLEELASTIAKWVSATCG